MAQPTPADVSVVDDPAIIKDVFGNPLDQYDLPQFQLHLYMAQNNDPDSENRFTIARTGVTPTQIDNVVIKTYANGVSAGPVTFTLTQPGHVTLIDQMLGARERLGLPLTVRPILFLEIKFTGYSTDLDDNDRGGQIQHIAGPYRYKLIIDTIAISITSEGSTYEVSTMMHNYYNFTDINFKVPAQMTIQAGSIRGALSDFKLQLEYYYKQNQRSYRHRDIFTFDLTDSSVKDFVDLPFSEEKRIGPLHGSTDDKSVLKYHEDNIEITGTNLLVKEGASFYGVIRALFSLVPEFRKEITRRTKIDDPSSTEVDINKTFVKWFKILTDSKENEFDEKRNDYAREYIFKTIVFDTASTEIDIPESSDMRGAAGVPVLKQRFAEIKSRGLLRKAYYYIFTGKNDQITALDIKFDTGENLFNQPTALNESSAVLAPGQSSTEIYYFLKPKVDTVKPGELLLRPWYRSETPEALAPARNIDSLFTWATTAPPRGQIQGPQIPHLVEGGSYYGFSNTIFGHLSYQHHLSAMGKTLIRLTMTVRGDPWYLGKMPNGDLLENRTFGLDAYTNPLAGCLTRDHTFFFLSLSSPRFPDDNYDDEDQGTGYWNYGAGGGMAKSFSGLYLLAQVTNTFSGGVFTCELSGHLMVEYQADQIAGDVPEPAENPTESLTVDPTEMFKKTAQDFMTSFKVGEPPND